MVLGGFKSLINMKPDPLLFESIKEGVVFVGKKMS
jgi:hypothetical protein